MSENRQSGFATNTNSSRLQWGTVPHQDPTKSSAIANRNCRVPAAASGREAIRAAGLGGHMKLKVRRAARRPRVHCRTRPATTSRPDYQPAGGQEVADSRSLSTLWRYASSCNFNNFGVLAFFRGCFRSSCLCRGAFGQLLAFGSHSLLDVTTLSSATTCPVLLPCDPVTAL